MFDYRRPLLAGLGAALAAVALAAPAGAAFPGTNGRVVFEYQPPRLLQEKSFYPYFDGSELWTSDASGGDVKALKAYDDQARTAAHDPSVSADGKQVAYVESSEPDSRLDEIRVIGLDGTGDHLVANAGDTAGAPTWSPDGTKLAFIQEATGQSLVAIENYDSLHVVKADGSGDATVIPVNGLQSSNLNNPQWSPDGKFIAFNTNGYVYVVPVAGGDPMVAGNRTEDDNECITDQAPNWAPDGSALVMQRYVYCSMTPTRRARAAALEQGGGIVEVAFQNGKPGTERHLAGIPTDGTPQRPAYSPDGLKVLYVRNFYDPTQGARGLLGKGDHEVWVAAADGTGPKVFVAGKGFDVNRPDWAAIPKAPPAVTPQAPVVTVVGGGAVKGETIRRCGSRRNFVIRLRPRGEKIVMARVIVNGKRIKAKPGRRWTATVDLRTLPRKRFKVDITVWTKSGKRFHEVRRYWTCTPAR
jgi:hypothetical protein